jgi:two-component system response regulator AtoC
VTGACAGARNGAPGTLIGESPPIRRLRALIAKVAPTDLPVLVQGPTGSGKELVASAIHAASGRAGPLVAFNVCAISEQLLEATLFGHVRGAFTGAHEDVAGYLTEADRGSLFLDEIGGLPLALQPKLLRALETRRFRPVGARADRSSDFRVISATNDELDVLLARGSFRADLAYRLRVVVLDVPPLKERLEDVPLLVEHFLRGRCAADRSRRLLDPAALEVLRAHDWPGNVRELRGVIETALAIAEAPVVSAADVRDALAQGRAVATGAPPPPAEAAARRGLLLTLLEEAGWDTAAAARAMGVHRATVYRWMRRAGIAPPRSRGAGFAPVRANSQWFAANAACGA